MTSISLIRLRLCGVASMRSLDELYAPTISAWVPFVASFEPHQDGGGRPAAACMAQGTRERQKLAPQLHRGAFCGSQDEATEGDGSHGAEQFVSERGSASDGCDIGGLIAREHRNPDVLAAAPEQSEPLMDSQQNAFFGLADGHHVLRVSDVPWPCAARLHHDERHDTHVGLLRDA
jgi:hypothetical protein